MTRYLASLCIVLMTAFGAAAYQRGQQTEATVYDESMYVLSFADMLYPPIAASARIQGVVVVAVTLNDEGRVTNASAVSGPKSLIPDSVANARKWTFRPNPMRQAVIVYDFTLEGVCHASGRSVFRVTHFNYARISSCRPLL